MSEPTARELAEMTAFELTAYRRELERVLGLPELPPIYLPREQLQAQLDAVRAEDAERERGGQANADA